MAVFWVTEALPIAVTALLPVFLFPVIGLMSVADASKQYINVSPANDIIPGFSLPFKYRSKKRGKSQQLKPQSVGWDF